MAEEKDVSVKDVVLDMVGSGNECGHTLADGTRQPVPTDGMAKWLGNGGEGFTHVGPCEIYIDDTMVLHGDNCEDEYTGGDVGSTVTSDMPVDYSSCNGDCTLTIYWLAFQNEQWQAYINCVPLSGSGSSTTSTSSTTTESSGTSSTAVEAEITAAPSTDAPSAASSSTETTQTTEAPSTEAPEATTQATEAPSTTTQTPSTEAPTTETKCNAPSRRLRKKTSTV